MLSVMLCTYYFWGSRGRMVVGFTTRDDSQ